MPITRILSWIGGLLTSNAFVPTKPNHCDHDMPPKPRFISNTDPYCTFSPSQALQKHAHFHQVYSHLVAVQLSLPFQNPGHLQRRRRVSPPWQMVKCQSFGLSVSAKSFHSNLPTIQATRLRDGLKGSFANFTSCVEERRQAGLEQKTKQVECESF